MTHVTCRLTAKNRDQLQHPTLGNRVWANFLYSKHDTGRDDQPFFVGPDITGVSLRSREPVIHRIASIYPINMPDAITLGEAYDGGATPVGLRIPIAFDQPQQ